MGIFYHKEPPNRSKRCKIVASALKGSFSGCCLFGGRLSSSDSEEEYEDIDIEDDYEVVESVIRSRVMEAKLSRKTTPHVIQPREDENEEEEEDDDDFYSAGSCFSRSSNAAGRDDIFSMNANFSSTSSLNGLDFSEPWRRSVIQALCHCEGWPFGLCRKAVLLPPLPKCPSESWSWTKGTKHA